MNFSTLLDNGKQYENLYYDSEIHKFVYCGGKGCHNVFSNYYHNVVKICCSLVPCSCWLWQWEHAYYCALYVESPQLPSVVL